MEKKLYVLIFISIILFSCIPKKTENAINTNETNNNTVNINNKNQTNNSQDTVVWDTNEYYLVNSNEGLRIRKEPEINSEKVGLFENNTVVYLTENSSNIVQIDGINANWVYVSRDNQKGWVFGGYLKEIPKINLYNYEYTNFKKSYGLLEVNDFSEDWESFYIFSKDYIAPYHEMMLLRSKLSTEINYSDFTIITGLYKRKDNFYGQFIAKIDIQEEKLLEINIFDYQSKKLLFLMPWTRNNIQYFSVGSTFESGFPFYVDSRNISKKIQWEEIY